MAMRWRLREFLVERGFSLASEISKIIRERTGHIISIQAICVLLNKPPKMLKVKTMNAICDAFYCKVSDFFEVIPRASLRPYATKTRIFGPTSSPKSGRTGPKRRAVAKQRSPSIDFAEFFPDARKFSTQRAIKKKKD